MRFFLILTIIACRLHPGVERILTLHYQYSDILPFGAAADRLGLLGGELQQDGRYRQTKVTREAPQDAFQPLRGYPLADFFERVADGRFVVL